MTSAQRADPPRGLTLGLAGAGRSTAKPGATTPVPAGRSAGPSLDAFTARPGMNVAKASEIVAIMLSPTLVVAAALYIPRGVRAIARRIGRHSDQVTHPPIEELAADLRRLLRQHETLKQSPGLAMRAKHLRAVEG